EAFIARWASDLRESRATGASIAAHPSTPPVEEAVARLLTGYHTLDPMQRTAKVRAALAMLDATPARSHGDRRPTPSMPAPTHAPAPTSRRPPPQFGAPTTRRPQPVAPDEPWPLAKPLPDPPILPGSRAASEPPAPRPAPRPEDEYLLGQPITAL